MTPGSIARASMSHGTVKHQAKHFFYASGWKKFEPLWNFMIRARRLDCMTPLLEAVLSKVSQSESVGGQLIAQGERMLHAVPNGGAAVAQEAVPRQNQISWGLLTVRVASSDRKCARSSPATLARCCLLAAGRRETEEVALPAGAGDSKLA